MMDGKKHMRDKNAIRLIKTALLVVMILCLIPVAKSCCMSILHERQERELRTLREEDGTTAAGEETTDVVGKGEDGDAIEEKTENAAGTIASAQWKELYSRNSDLIGWLTIEGTRINYPVMQCEDDEYYLHHNFEKEEDKYGCLHVKKIADVATPGTNIIIYGHHMKDDSMFGELDKYESESFCREHGEISFETLREERIYQVMAAFRTDVTEREGESGFRYYQFYQADTEEEFADFYENVRELSIYDTGVTAEFGDTFLTLSTCSGHSENGRFVVVAKRIRD